MMMVVVGWEGGRKEGRVRVAMLLIRWGGFDRGGGGEGGGRVRCGEGKIK